MTHFQTQLQITATFRKGLQVFSIVRYTLEYYELQGALFLQEVSGSQRKKWATLGSIQAFTEVPLGRKGGLILTLL
jgi:hypothetical protein